MEHLVEFKNFKLTKTEIAADLCCDGNYVVRMTDEIKHLNEVKETPVGLYKYFRVAALKYIKLTLGGHDGNDTVH